MKKVIIILLVLCVSLSGDFVQKWNFPQGIYGSGGRILIGDTDRDGSYEFYIRTYGGSQKVYIYELHLPNTWEVDSFDYLYSTLAWDLGDFDLDGLYDLVLDGSATPSYPTMVISVAESPDSFSYPTSEVWRDTVGQPLVIPISVYDIDLDGVPEIVKPGANGIDFVIYESTGNNFYEKIYEDTIQGINTPTSTIAFEDFDGDGSIEFVLGNLSDGVGAAYWLYESPADNTYEFIHLGSVSTKNIKDCFSVSDADQDGKWEFVVKGFVIPSAEIHTFIFEATGDNTYEIIRTFTLPGGDYDGGYSDAGDIDGDSIPEIVLEARQNVFVIKSAGNNAFYLWDTLPGHASGSNVRIFDIDGNGLSEIIISGNNETRIYEYDPGGIEEAQDKTHVARLEVYPNPIHKKCNIKYVLPQHSNVNVSLFDVTGRLIKEIVNEKQIGGIYYKTFDMTDLPQGIYFFRLETRDYKETRKAILLK